jgi:hypothetical protein
MKFRPRFHELLAVGPNILVQVVDRSWPFSFEVIVHHQRLGFVTLKCDGLKSLCDTRMTQGVSEVSSKRTCINSDIEAPNLALKLVVTF